MQLRAFAVVVAAAWAGGGCEAQQGTLQRCACAFLTDFDDASATVVEVCSSAPERAATDARACAQSGAPAPVQSCTCERTVGPPCSLGACEVR